MSRVGGGKGILRTGTLKNT